MKKNQVKAAKVVVLGYSAAMAVAGSMISLDAAAACTDGAAAAPLHCEFDTSATLPFAEAWSFTGSNNVKMYFAGDATGFGVCAFNKDGKNSYGQSFSSNMKAVTGTGVTSAVVSGGC
jgi:hypothetical protein